MRSAGVGEPTIRQALVVLQAIFTYAHAEDRVPDNPIRSLTKPRQAVEREVRLVAPATVERLRARLGTRDALMVAVLASGCVRRSCSRCGGTTSWTARLRIRRKNVHGQLLAWEGHTLLEAGAKPGTASPCATATTPARGRRPRQRVTAEAAIRAAREPGVRGVCARFDPTPEALS